MSEIFDLIKKFLENLNSLYSRDGFILNSINKVNLIQLKCI